MKTNVLFYLACLGTALLLCSCAQNSNHPKPALVGRTERAGGAKGDATFSAEDVLKVVRNKDVVTVMVPSDPAYGVPHRYRAVSFMKEMEGLSALSPSELDQCEFAFDCEDGYRAVLRGIVGRVGPAFLAIADLEAPANEDWVPIKKASGSMVPGPLYLVWTNTIPDDHRPKPYQIIRIGILSGGDSLLPAYPSGDARARAGFELFRKNCMACHSVNGVGGKVGVDLNYPLNVSEYWRKEYIKKLIREPQSVRSNARMPAFPQLSSAEIDLLVIYLSDMKSRKVGPQKN
jgi:mono/diheme cytochrome c family protein